MSQFNNNARIVDAVVIEVCTDAALATHAPAVQAMFQPCPANVVANWTFTPPSTWTAPAPPPTPAPVYPTLAAFEFQMLFTTTEYLLIKNSVDPVVGAFWDIYQSALQTGSPVNLNSPRIQEGLTYLATVNQSPAPSSAPAWAKSTVYAQGATVSVGTSVYTCTTAGTSAASGNGPSGTGTGIADGSCAWSYTATPTLGANRVAQILAGTPQ